MVDDPGAKGEGEGVGVMEGDGLELGVGGEQGRGSLLPPPVKGGEMALIRAFPLSTMSNVPDWGCTANWVGEKSREGVLTGGPPSPANPGKPGRPATKAMEPLRNTFHKACPPDSLMNTPPQLSTATPAVVLSATVVALGMRKGGKRPLRATVPTTPPIPARV